MIQAKVSRAAGTTLEAPTDDPLAGAIKKKLDGGASPDDVIATLARSLATQVAQQLGITDDAGKAKLAQAFATQLRSLDSGPALDTGQRAATLAASFRQIAGIATRVADGNQGQPIRLIDEHHSDAAHTARVASTPTTETTDIRASGASAPVPVLPAPPSPSAPALSAPALAADAQPAIAAAVHALAGGDGRTVALAQNTAVSNGGDSLLGRALNRAQLAQRPIDDLRTPAPQAPARPVDPDAFVRAFTSAATRAFHDQRGGGDAEARVLDLDGRLSPVPPLYDAGTPPAFAAVVPAVMPDAVPAVPAAQPAPPPAGPTVDPSAVMEQVLRGIGIRTHDGQSEVRLRLVPEALGDVSVKLTVAGGFVDAQITAATPDAQNALAGAQAQLARTLADAGLKLQNFAVSLAGGSFAGHGDARRDDSTSQKTVRRIGAIAASLMDDESAGELDSLLAIPSFAPPIYTAAIPGRLEALV